MTTTYLRGFAERADNAPGDGPIRFVIATEGRKADGIDLRMDRLSLDRYLANPVVMYGHDYWGRESLPIGRAENVHVDGDRLLADAVFDLDDPFAAQVDRKYRGGYLNAVSVGFDLRGFDNATGVPDSWELLEFSAVPIPLDPDALVESGRAALRALNVQIREALGDTDEPNDDTEDDEPETPETDAVRGPSKLTLARARLARI